MVMFFPLMRMTPLMLGVRMFIVVSSCAVAASSQFSFPLNDLIIGMRVSIAGTMSITSSAVTSMNLKSNPALISFFDRVA